MPLCSDEEALLAAINVAPMDDAPRLVYADWLQDRGDESKADYLRTVVRLMHAPEDAGDVARIVALAPGLDEIWRHRVGGRFEVFLEGSKPAMLFAHVLAAFWKILAHDAIDMWWTGTPVRLRTEITREEAQRIVASFVTPLLAAGDPPVKLSVAVMGEETGPTLFAPRN